MDITGKSILKAWEDAQKKGESRAEFARKLGISKKTLDNKIDYQRNKGRRSFAKKKRKHEDLFEDYTDGNYRKIIAKTERIYSIEELLKRCQIDLTVWRIDDKMELGAHEMGRRAERKDIKWENGAIVEGYSEDHGELYINTLFRYRVPLVRINPIPIEPALSPIGITITDIPSKSGQKLSRTGKVLIIPDMQIGFSKDVHTGKLVPFHDRVAMSIVLQIAQKNDFDAVTYLGDFLDLSEWSDKFIKRPEFYWTTQPAFIECSWFFSQIKKALPRATHQALQGNHEIRFESQMITHLRSAYRLRPATELNIDDPMTIQRMLGMDEIGVEYVNSYPNGEVYHGEYLRCIHGSHALSKSLATVDRVLKQTTVSTVFGHIHRIEQASKRIDDSHGSRQITALSPGCLCRLDYIVPGHKRGQDWRQGFAVAYYDQKSPVIYAFPIDNGKTIYNGIEYNGYDYTKNVKKDTGWEF